MPRTAARPQRLLSLLALAALAALLDLGSQAAQVAAPTMSPTLPPVSCQTQTGSSPGSGVAVVCQIQSAANDPWAQVLASLPATNLGSLSVGSQQLTNIPALDVGLFQRTQHPQAPDVSKLTSLVLESVVAVRGPPLCAVFPALDTFIMRSGAMANVTSTLLGPPACRALRVVEISSFNVQRIAADVFQRGGPASLLQIDLYNNLLSSLPETLFRNMPNLTELAVSSNNLRSLPPTLLHNLPQLSSFDITENNLQELPPGLLRDSPSLATIMVGSNNLSALDDSVFAPHVPELSYFAATTNILTRIPTAVLGAARKLSYLDLSFNKLTEIPVARLCSATDAPLTAARLNGNLLHVLPHTMFVNCSNMQALYLTYNKLTQLPLLDSLPSLSEFDANNNQITSLPDNLFRASAPSLQTVFLAYNNISRLGQVVTADFGQLTSITFSNNRVTQVSSTLLGVGAARPQNLNYLTLTYNAITSIPDTVLVSLPSLEGVYIDNNNLSKLPFVSNVPSLVTLSAASNSIPAIAYQLPKTISKLDLSSNRITAINPAFLPIQLEFLLLQDNLLSEMLPRTFASCPSIVSLLLAANRITKIHLGAFSGLPLHAHPSRSAYA